jgi:HAD superfamily hydrolase (TIGR01484 family)
MQQQAHKLELREMTVNCLLLDYDGTISPLNLPRAESKVPPKTYLLLEQISRKIPIAIITTKDASFVVPRTKFASAWSTIAGLEYRIGDRITTKSSKYNGCIFKVLEHVKLMLMDTGIEVEEKRDSQGRAVAFGVDWRRARNIEAAKQKAEAIAKYCEAASLKLVRYRNQPYYDVYPVRVDKGKATKAVLEELDERTGSMYMGDSEFDNPAFLVSDLSLGVVHDETPVEGLVCEYLVEFDEVADFLTALLWNDLRFNSDFSMITRNQWKRRSL